MKRIEPIDFEELNKRVKGMQIGDAVVIVAREFAAKINEVVEDYNERMKNEFQ